MILFAPVWIAGIILLTIRYLKYESCKSPKRDLPTEFIDIHRDDAGQFNRMQCDVYVGQLPGSSEVELSPAPPKLSPSGLCSATSGHNPS
jgi:hypothetical protein